MSEQSKIHIDWGAVVFVVIMLGFLTLMGCVAYLNVTRRADRTPMPPPVEMDNSTVSWSEPSGWTATETDGTVRFVELGFKSDGTLIWRAGREKHE